MYFQNMNLIETATFKTTQKHVKQRMWKLVKRLAATVETSNGKFHLVLRGNVSTIYILFGTSFIHLKIQRQVQYASL